jgi:Fe-Mn family superoxide dismutase
MELHHSKHHNTYVTSLNNFSEQMAEAKGKEDIQSQIALQPMINFHGGGHVNHTLFWENLAPTKNGGGEPPTGKLAQAINDGYGSLDAMKEKFNAALAGVQGSGWAWLVQDVQTGNVLIKTYAVGCSLRTRLDTLLMLCTEPGSRRWPVPAYFGYRCLGARILVS